MLSYSNWIIFVRWSYFYCDWTWFGIVILCWHLANSNAMTVEPLESFRLVKRCWLLPTFRLCFVYSCIWWKTYNYDQHTRIWFDLKQDNEYIVAWVMVELSPFKKVKMSHKNILIMWQDWRSCIRFRVLTEELPSQKQFFLPKLDKHTVSNGLLGKLIF